MVVSYEYHYREMLAEVLNSVQNSHPSIPGHKMDFVIALMDCPIELLKSEGFQFRPRLLITPTIFRCP